MVTHRFDEVDALLDRFVRTRDPETRAQLVRHYVWLARRIARRFAGRGESTDDLEQVAYVGLINAIDRFDPARGAQFCAFAEPTITGELRRHFRDRRWIVRVGRSTQERYLAVRAARDELCQELRRVPTVAEIGQRLGLDIGTVVDAMDAGDSFRPSFLNTTGEGPGGLAGSDSGFDAVEARDLLRSLVAGLPETDRTIVRLRSQGLTQREIGQILGVSQMQVSRRLMRTRQLLSNQVVTSGAP